MFFVVLFAFCEKGRKNSFFSLKNEQKRHEKRRREDDEAERRGWMVKMKQEAGALLKNEIFAVDFIKIMTKRKKQRGGRSEEETTNTGEEEEEERRGRKEEEEEASFIHSNWKLKMKLQNATTHYPGQDSEAKQSKKKTKKHEHKKRHTFQTKKNTNFLL